MAKVRRTFLRISSYYSVNTGAISVVIKNPADFVGAHLGQSEKNTKSILESTQGKVLVIDEVSYLCCPCQSMEFFMRT